MCAILFVFVCFLKQKRLVDNTSKNCILMGMNGIDEALNNHTQVELAVLLTTRSGRKVHQQQISHWKHSGYVPGRWARAVSDITGIPLDRLIAPEVT